MIYETPPIMKNDDDTGNITALRDYLVRLSQTLTNKENEEAEETEKTSTEVSEEEQAKIIGTAANKLYPKGTLYYTTDSTFNPNNKFPGTWEQLTADAYIKIVTANAGTTGGTSSEHKIPIESMPEHNHSATGKMTRYYASGTIGDDFPSGTDGETGYTGDGEPYYPYYYGVYVWHRTK